MKGYMTFIIVFAAFLVLLYSMQLFYQSQDINQSRAIAVSRVYDVEMNVKESVIEISRQAAKQGYLVYLKKVIATCGPLDIDPIPGDELLCYQRELQPDKIEKAVREAVHPKLALLAAHKFSEDVDVRIWCREPDFLHASRDDLTTELNNLVDKMHEQKSVNICANGCHPIESEECLDAVSFKVIDVGGIDMNNIADPPFPKLKFTNTGGSKFIGISSYLDNYKVASVSYISVSYNTTLD